MELTTKQAEGLKIAVQRFKDHQPWTCIAGYAGTGKSTLVKFIVDALGIDKNYLETTGIGIRQLTTNGGSLMDCIPWDPCMVDIAAEKCSDDKSTSAEKRDVDEIKTPQARIGHM